MCTIVQVQFSLLIIPQQSETIDVLLMFTYKRFFLLLTKLVHTWTQLEAALEGSDCCRATYHAGCIRSFRADCCTPNQAQRRQEVWQVSRSTSANTMLCLIRAMHGQFET